MLVTEYLEGGNLTTALERDSSSPPKFSWYKQGRDSQSKSVQGLNKRVAMDIARGLAFLHNRKVGCATTLPWVCSDECGDTAKTLPVQETPEHFEAATSLSMSRADILIPFMLRSLVSRMQLGLLCHTCCRPSLCTHLGLSSWTLA